MEQVAGCSGLVLWVTGIIVLVVIGSVIWWGFLKEDQPWDGKGQD